MQSLRSMLGDVKFLDLKNVSAVSAADFAFNVADADKDASLSIDEFAALGKRIQRTQMPGRFLPPWMATVTGS